MFANRFTAFIDACVLASALKRNLLCTLAEAEFFRVRWSEQVLNETESAICKILESKGEQDAQGCASRARAAMDRAFPEAMVVDFDNLMRVGECLPDKGDKHVLAAALRAQASTIVTDNLKDFPMHLLTKLGLQIRSADAFLADTISLDAPRAVFAIGRMRRRFHKPEKTSEILLIDMEKAGLTETADVLREYIDIL